MTTIAAGATGTYTFPDSTTGLAISLDPNERAAVSVLRSGKTIFSTTLSSSQTVGPFQAGDVASLTAVGAAIDYVAGPYSPSQSGVFIGLSPSQLSQTPAALVAAGVITQTQANAATGTTFYSTSDPTALYRINAGGTAFIAAASGGGGGSSTYAGLTDAATVDLPATNTPLATSLDAIGTPGKATKILPAGSATFADALQQSIDKLNRSRSDYLFKMVFDVDSTGTGVSSPSSTRLSAAQQVGAHLRRTGIKVNTTTWSAYLSFGNQGFPDPRVDDTGTGITRNANSPIIGGGWWAVTSTGKISFQCDSLVNKCQIVSLSKGASSLGTLTVDIGGAAIYSQLQSNSGANGTLISPVIDLGSFAAHKIYVGATGGEVDPVYVYAWNSSEPGVVILTNGSPGKSSAGAVANYGSPGYYSTNLYPVLQPDLTFISNTLNNLNSATQLADMTKMITAAQNSGFGQVVLYDGPQPSSAQSGYANYASIIAANKQAASNMGCAYLSIDQYIGANPGTGNTYYIAGDNVGHLMPTGYARLFAAVARPLVACINI